MNSTTLPRLIFIPLIYLLSGCSSISYYAESIQGQLDIMTNAVPIERLLQDGTLAEDTHKQLANVGDYLQFAEQVMLLPNNGSYQDYVDTGRDFVVWNVFAAEELSFTPVESCFLFVGCLGYRGFFSKQSAKDHAEQLKSDGYDVFMGGVAAYSTLGWLDDPVLNTMLRHDERYLFRVIVHELAHQKFYLKGDSAFSEGFADAVADIAETIWQQQTSNSREDSNNNQYYHYEKTFINLVLEYKRRLEKLYDSSLTADKKRQRKQSILKEMRSDYEILKADWNHYAGFDAWFSPLPNNARFLVVQTYRDYVPGFLKLFEMSAEDPEKFYELVASLSQCNKAVRDDVLLKQKAEWSC